MKAWRRSFLCLFYFKEHATVAKAFSFLLYFFIFCGFQMSSSNQLWFLEVLYNYCERWKFRWCEFDNSFCFVSETFQTLFKWILSEPFKQSRIVFYTFRTLLSWMERVIIDVVGKIWIGGNWNKWPRKNHSQ